MDYVHRPAPVFLFRDKCVVCVFSPLGRWTNDHFFMQQSVWENWSYFCLIISLELKCYSTFARLSLVMVSGFPQRLPMTDEQLAWRTNDLLVARDQRPTIDAKAITFQLLSTILEKLIATTNFFLLKNSHASPCFHGGYSIIVYERGGGE